METLNIVPKGLEVPPEKIESELRKLFTSDKPVTRSSLMNLAIYSEVAGSMEENTATLEEVTKEHSCRGIVIEMQRDAEVLSLRSWINLHCRLVAGKKSICSEQISFLLSGRSENLLPNTVLAHLDSDLPLVFWWQCGCLEHLEPELYTRIDRLIIDSARWDEPLRQFRILEKAYRDPGSRFIVLDIAWTRVSAMRMALAGCFDAPEAASKVASLTDVELAAGPARRLEARLLGAWIAKQAGWQLDETDESGNARFVRADGSQISMRFTALAQADAIPELVLSGPGARFSLRHQEDSGLLLGESHLAGVVTSRLYPGPMLGVADLVTERLRRGCNNKLYFELLCTVRQLLGEKMRRRD